MSPPLKKQMAHLMEMGIAEVASLPALKRCALGLLRFTWQCRKSGNKHPLDAHCRASILA